MKRRQSDRVRSAFPTQFMVAHNVDIGGVIRHFIRPRRSTRMLKTLNIQMHHCYSTPLLFNTPEIFEDDYSFASNACHNAPVQRWLVGLIACVLAACHNAP